MALGVRYRDPGLSIEARVTDLLGQMTLAEKIAQLGSIWAFEIVGPSGVDPDRMGDLLADGIGEVTRLAGSTNLRPTEVAMAANAIQRHLAEETRLGIPAIVHEECLHGLLGWGAPCFQQAIGAAATFDPDLHSAVAATIRRRLLLTGARHALAPVLDIARDARWGRIEETYGEDPYLAAAMGVAYVRAIQGADPKGEDPTGAIIATGKHIVGHGLAEGGLNQAPAHAGWRELRDEQLLPFEAAIREAGLGSVMPAYCDVDGVPCHASRELLEGVVRDEWGFDGIVASDYVGVAMLRDQHKLTADLAVAAALALEAGVDLELPRSAAYGDPLVRAIETGRIAESVLDAAVARVLRAKFRLGLFEAPYVEPPSPAELADLAAVEALVGRDLARRSMVLVENDGTLPLAPERRRIAVIGPSADSPRELLGDYSHVVHIQTLLEMRGTNNAFGYAVTDEVTVDDELTGRRTILDALRDRLETAEVRHARGTGIRDGTDDEIAAAAAAARWAEVAIVCLGERSGLTDDATTGEFRDRCELGLIGRQQELLEAVVASGTPVVLVVVSGRPLALEWAARQCAAILLAWVPGDEGPDAIVDVLLGAENPGGKLPVTIPRHVGQVPLTYRHHPTGGRSQWKGDYVDGSATALWPFGYGRSYTSFTLSDLRLEPPELSTTGGRTVVRVDIANVGVRAGDEVVQLYARDEEASVARPVLELLGFRRLGLAPGERRTVVFELAAEQFAYTGVDYRRIVEPGVVRLFAGTSSADLPLSALLRLVGPVVDLPVRRRFVTPSTIE
jgi:beta-glucosidase